MDSLQEFGIRLIQALQTLSPALDRPMGLISFLGTIEFYLLLIPLVYWTVSPPLGLRLLMVLIGTDVLGTALKQMLHQPRPYWLGRAQPLAVEPSYGIPSTHASDSLAVWGYLARFIKRSWGWAATALLVLLIGLSRLYLGVHFPQDVLGGWLVGGLMLLLFAAYEQRFAAWWARLPGRAQAGLGLLASLAILGIGFGVLGLIGGVTDPIGWASFSGEARSPAHYFTLAGAFFGAVAASVLMRRYAPFQPGGSLPRRALRYAVGLIGLLLIWRGLDAIFGLVAPDASLAGYGLRYVRYAATSFWAIFGAPWLFLKTRLAERGPATERPQRSSRPLRSSSSRT